MRESGCLPASLLAVRKKQSLFADFFCGGQKDRLTFSGQLLSWSRSFNRKSGRSNGFHKTVQGGPILKRLDLGKRETNFQSHKNTAHYQRPVDRWRRNDAL